MICFFRKKKKKKLIGNYICLGYAQCTPNCFSTFLVGWKHMTGTETLKTKVLFCLKWS